MDTNKNKIYYIQQKLLYDKTNKYYSIINILIKKYNLEYSSNKNGIFLNISALESKFIDIIYNNFVNSEEIISSNTDIKELNPVIIPTIKKEYKSTKDKLNFDKFDKFLLQQSKTNISL
tara:strand:+ start:651 stop:1007 length:357 start_codon:yes stop_codon:yes gene_type:complete